MNASSGTSFGCEAAVIGAGPYGLAAAAHLRARGVATRVFGEPLSFWRRNMPLGMKLRSPWGASSIADPAGALSLDAFVAARGLARIEPLPLETFLEYGDWLQPKAAPDLERKKIVRIEAAGRGFRLTTAEQEIIAARRVVIAAGLAHQDFRPEVFAGAPAELVTHTFEHDDLAKFRGRRVAVVGRGQSACESAALLAEAGAEPELICRGPVRWLGAGLRTAGLKAALAPILTAPSAVGRFPLNWFNEAPGLARLLPHPLRAAASAASLKAGAAGWLLPRFDAVRIRSGVEIAGWSERGGRIELAFPEGAASFDHVLLATGYRIDVGKLGLFGPELLGAMARRDGSPILSRGFESSVPGLHFVGAAAVSSFGPLLRFIAGSGFAARAVTRVIAPARRPQRAGADDLAYDLAR